MDRAESAGPGLLPGNSRKHGDHAFGSLKSVVPPSAFLQPFIEVCIVLIFAFTFVSKVAASQQSFNVTSTSYNCSSTIICRGGAHVFMGGNISDSRIQHGRLSLVPDPSEPNTAGTAYYYQQVKFLDLATGQSASFNTSFTIDIVPGIYPDGVTTRGDGMTFLLTEDNLGLGGVGSFLGIFNGEDGITTSKSLVVEFDTIMNDYRPMYDISDNHVSFDFMNITYAVAANASDVNVSLFQDGTIYAWVEYSSKSKQLEARISANNSRPSSYLLRHRVDLLDVVGEYMWVGFSSATGDMYSNYYIGDWTFLSYGLIPESSPPAGSKLGVILGISAGLPVLAGIVIALYLCKTSDCRGHLCWTKHITEETTLRSATMPREFSYKQLSVATGGFNEESKLGQGGFGSVYRGVLPSSGIPVAVKKISGNSSQGEKEFMTEVSVISQLRHRNLIQILGWCKGTTKEKYLIVYELMPNGSLDKALFGPADSKTPSLSWNQRFNIVTGIAAALDYLHQGLPQQIIHRDVKSSNIMLGEEWTAKLGDFGLARLVDHQKEADATKMAGTYGYIAPEVPATGKFTDKTDVFAFGAVVLEVACGRRALSVNVPDDEVVLVNWVWAHLSVGDLMSTVDKRLKSDYDPHWMEVMLIIGLLCSHPRPLARPSMRHVVQVLAGDAPLPSIPDTKPDSGTGAADAYLVLHAATLDSASKSRGSTLSPAGR